MLSFTKNRDQPRNRQVCLTTPSTAPHRESGRPLAQSPATGPGLAPNTLPVWAIKPWFGIGFHCAHISSIYGVLLYPILGGVARHA